MRASRAAASASAGWFSEHKIALTGERLQQRPVGRAALRLRVKPFQLRGLQELRDAAGLGRLNGAAVRRVRLFSIPCQPPQPDAEEGNRQDHRRAKP